MKSIRFLVPALLSLAALDATAQSCTSLVVNGQSVSYGGFEVRVTNIGAPCDAGFATKVMPEGEQPLGSGNVIAQVWPFNQPDPIDGSTWSLSSVASLTPPSGPSVPLNTYGGRYIGTSWALGTDEAYTVRFSALPNAFIGDGPQCFLFTAGNLQSFVGEPFAVNLSEETPANRPNNTTLLCVAPGGGNSGPDLSIAKTDDVDPVSAGGVVTYTLTVVNEGDAIAELSRITDVLPAGWAFVSASASVGACSHVAGTVNCDVGSIIAGGSRTVTVVAQAPSAAGVYVNNASVVTASAESNTENNTTQETTTVVSFSDLEFTKTGPATVEPGTPVTWEVTVSNAGPSPATNLVMVDTLPAGTTFQSVSPAVGCALSGSQVVCGLTSFAVGATHTWTITALAPSSPGTIINTCIGAADQPDPTPADPNCRATTVVQVNGADLSFGKTGPATVAAGAPISWTITGSNAGPSVATNVTVTDNVPAGVTGITASGTGWSCSIAAQTVTCTRPSLAVGAAPAITISGTAPTTAQTLVNTCSATSAEPDPTPGGTCEATTIVQPVVDLSIVKTADQQRVGAEQPLAWGIEVRNEGISTASSIAVTDTLPAGYVATTATGDGWTCSIAGPSVSCTRPALAAGASSLIVIDGTAPVDLGILVNRVTVAAAEDEPNMDNNEAQASAEVVTRGVEPQARPHVIPATDAWSKILLLFAVFGIAVAAIRRQ